MRLSKIFYSLGAAGILALSNVALAAVINFGNLQAPHGYIVKNVNFGDDAFVASLSDNSSRAPIDQTINNLVTMNRVVFSSVNRNYGYGLRDIDLRRKFERVSYNKYYKDKWNAPKPVTSPVPEPETYAMILAGLGLIFFTARNRKRDA